MIILGIETSCDETALALIEAEGDSVRVLANITHSQAALHAKYGGVFPNLAKREHARNLIPLLKAILTESNFLNQKLKKQNKKLQSKIESEKEKKPRRYSDVLENIRIILEREPELRKQFEKFIPTIKKPAIDVIAVTFGPGLEPALWVGINFARALSAVWNIPVIPTNHMEGHIFSALLCRKEKHKAQHTKTKQDTKQKALKLNAIRYTLNAPVFPALALLISGGHTELVLVKDWHSYEIIGETRDDAVGEAFDKVARILGLKYPGGPEISRLAEKARSYKLTAKSFPLPRPMLHSGDFDFSFSGLKTAVLYTVKKIPKVTAEIKQELAREFEDAVTEVLIAKTRGAIEQYGAQSLLLGGGVVANKHIRRSFQDLANKYDRTNLPRKKEFLHIPEADLTTDNALMIALAGFLNLKSGRKPQKAGKAKITAEGRARLS